jgi:hypothetical protein
MKDVIPCPVPGSQAQAKPARDDPPNIMNC